MIASGITIWAGVASTEFGFILRADHSVSELSSTERSIVGDIDAMWIGDRVYFLAD